MPLGSWAATRAELHGVDRAVWPPCTPTVGIGLDIVTGYVPTGRWGAELANSFGFQDPMCRSSSPMSDGRMAGRQPGNEFECCFRLPNG